MSEKQKKIANHIFEYLVATGNLESIPSNSENYSGNVYRLKLNFYKEYLLNILTSAIADFDSKEIEELSKEMVTAINNRSDIIKEMQNVKRIFETSVAESFGEMEAQSKMANQYWNTLKKHPWLRDMGFDEDDVSDPKND